MVLQASGHYEPLAYFHKCVTIACSTYVTQRRCWWNRIFSLKGNHDDEMFVAHGAVARAWQNHQSLPRERNTTPILMTESD